VAPSDYHLFSALKDHLRGRTFETDNEVLAAIQAWYDSKPENYFSDGIDQLVPKMEECIRLKGEYIPK
jgi:hypothetical protein